MQVCVGTEMKPITHLIQMFTPKRVEHIRTARVLSLAEGLEVLGKGHKGAKTSKKRKTTIRKKVSLTPQAKAKMAGLDAATRAFLEDAMK